MRCFNKNPQTSFIFEQIEHKVEVVAAKSNAVEIEADFEQKTEQTGQHLADSALSACSDVSCAIETAEDPWRKETDQILLNISQDKSLAMAFNTFLAEYVRQFGQSLELTDDPTTNFYTAIEMA